MRDVGGILDFLEDYDLHRPPERSGESNPRVGHVGPDEVIVEIDWEALTSSRRDAEPLTLSPAFEEVLGELGRARTDAKRLRGNAGPPTWDSCAWYAPIHYYGPAWGIYIREDCLTRLAREIGWFAWDSPLTSETGRYLRLAAFFMLYLHEDFHHKLEGFGIRLALSDRATPDHYLRYDASVYQASLGTDDNLEEALASADAYQRLGGKPYKDVLPAKIRSALRRWMKWRFNYIDLPGHRMARKYLTEPSFTAGAQELQNQVLEASLTPKSNPAHWQAGPNMLRSIFSITSDIYLIIPASSVPSFPVSVRPYTVSLRQTEQWLKQNGFTKLSDRGKGDHELYQRADGLQAGLDGGARELSRQIERTIAKALGMPQHQLRTAISEGRRLRANRL